MPTPLDFSDRKAYQALAMFWAMFWDRREGLRPPKDDRRV